MNHDNTPSSEPIRKQPIPMTKRPLRHMPQSKLVYLLSYLRTTHANFLAILPDHMTKALLDIMILAQQELRYRLSESTLENK